MPIISNCYIEGLVKSELYAICQMMQHILKSSRTFQTYVHVSLFLILKMLFMTLLTIKERFRKGVFTSPEDGTYRKIVITFDDEDIERVRRAHRNDVENIPIFIIVAFFYCLTKPDEEEAVLLFTLYTIARITHTFVYAIYVIPQPARVLSFFTGYTVTLYMIYKIFFYMYSDSKTDE